MAAGLRLLGTTRLGACAERSGNEDPISKIEAFAKTIEAGVGDHAEVAFFKFCYIDFKQDTDVDKVFDRYQSTMSRLKASYPKTTFAHMTVPLDGDPAGRDRDGQAPAREGRVGRGRELGPGALQPKASGHLRGQRAAFRSGLARGYRSPRGARVVHLGGAGRAAASSTATPTTDST